MRDYFLFDGAFGTYIAERNLPLALPEMANISHEDVVFSIHQEYIESGVDAIKTNTFAANIASIADENTRKAVIQRGCAIAARAAAPHGIRVYADIGPIHHDASADEYIKIVDIFLSCGASRFLFETLDQAQDLRRAIAHIRSSTPNAEIIVSFAVSQDGYTQSGLYYQSLLEEASGYGADHVGLNCLCGPAHMLSLIQNVDTSRYSMIAMPNAGYPSVIGRRTVYVDNPEYFADKLYDIYRCGVKTIGGCCGTTPSHIRAVAERVRQASAPRPSIRTQAREKRAEAPAMDFNRTIVAVEINAPADTNIDYLLRAGNTARESGADFVTIPDSPLGKSRANSFMISSLLQRETHIKAIPHICCRDKNQIAIKSDLVAANIEHITHVLAVTGDPIQEIDRGSINHVFGFNSLKLIRFIKSLNERLFTDAPFTIFAALNINAPNFALEIKRAGEKIAAGADCLMTQPIFSDKNIEHYLKAKRSLNCRILAGILPAASYKNALFLNNEVPGIEIPDEMLAALQNARPEEAEEICVGYAINIVDRLKAHCDGYYVMTPLHKMDFSASIIKHIRGR